MKQSLRRRLRWWGVGVLSYLVIFAGAVAIALVSAFGRVQQALQPFADILPRIAAREQLVYTAIDTLSSRLASAEPTDTEPPPNMGRGSRSLLAHYAGELNPAASAALAAVEEALAGVETQIGQAWAAYAVHDLPRARTKLMEIREARRALDASVERATAVALDAGNAARARLGRAMARALIFAVLWMLSGFLLVALIARDLGRHVLAPVAELDAGVRRIGAGDWSTPVPQLGDDELGVLARHFNAMAGVLRSRAGRHAQFATAGELLAGAAHELNNPLQTIRSIAELRQSGAATGGAADWQRVLAATERASRLVRDLGRFVGARRRTQQTLALNDCVREALDLIAFQFSADGIAIEETLAADLPPVEIDPNELVQVIVNLLGNAHAALRGWSDARRVEVRTWATGSTVFFRVHDSGPGVPVELRGQIFDPFFTTKEVGVGLGLAVSRDIIRAHGGDLMLDLVDGGAQFTLRLPAVAESIATRPAPTTVVGAGRDGRLDGVRILVVDDEEAVRSVLFRFFRHEGANAELAGGGGEALERIRQGTFDAIVLDLRMPDVDGSRVFEMLVREHPEAAARTIVLSGDPSDLADTIDIPASRILHKPVELADLKRAVLAVSPVG